MVFRRIRQLTNSPTHQPTKLVPSSVWRIIFGGMARSQAGLRIAKRSYQCQLSAVSQNTES